MQLLIFFTHFVSTLQLADCCKNIHLCENANYLLHSDLTDNHCDGVIF